MNDQELVYSIADLMGFERDYRKLHGPSGYPAHYFDAECDAIPDYVFWLGREDAESLYKLLLTVKAREAQYESLASN